METISKSKKEEEELEEDDDEDDDDEDDEEEEEEDENEIERFSKNYETFSQSHSLNDKEETMFTSNVIISTLNNNPNINVILIFSLKLIQFN